MNESKILPVSKRRRERQSGLAAIEFGLFAVMMGPAMVWMFISGMNFIRYNRANDITRSVAMLYIKGTPMHQLGTQRLVARVASGTGLVVESGGVITNAQGSGLITLTRVQYVGNGCGCVNAGKYVMTQRIHIGNTGLQINGVPATSLAGATPTAIWNSTNGTISNPTGNTAAVVSTNFSSLWGNSMADGQFTYLVESWFRSPSMGGGEFDAGGVYTRVFM